MELTIKIELPETAVQAFVDFVKQMGQVKAAPGETVQTQDYVIIPTKYYTVKSACKFTNLEAEALRKRAREGIIEYRKPGKYIEFLGQDLINYLEKGKGE